jgi:vitamin B12 transporter
LELTQETTLKQKLMKLLAIPLGRQKAATKWLVIITVALFGAITLPFAAYAETPMELMIVTATRMPQSLDKTIADTTVLSEQDIRKSGAPDVPTLLRSLAGVEVVQSGGLGKVSSTFMRGTNSDQVLVLLDGVRINSATTGSTAIDQLMLEQVERIEVVRGNVSSLYGSEAIGGVIQIFTKRGKGEPTFNVSGGVGTHNTQRAAAGFGGAVESNDFNVQVSKFKTDGVSAINPSIVPTVNPDKDGYDNSSLSANVRHLFNADHSLSGSLFLSQGKVQFDDASALITAVNTSTSTLSKVALVSDNRFSEMWQSKLQYANGTDELKTYLNGLPDPFGGYVKTQNRQLSWQNNLALDANNNALLGAENLQQQVSSDTPYAQTERHINSLFGGYTGDFGAHRVQVNLRQDRYSDFGMANTGLLGYGYAINQAWRVTASASTAFKAPTFNDLYGPAAWGSNPNLKPERSRNKEFGMHYVEGEQHIDVVYFDNLIRDLIAADNTFTLQNLNSAHSDGLEISCGGQFGDTSAKAALTVQNPRDTTTGQVLLRRTKQFANLAVAQHVGAWEAGGEWQYSGARQDGDINTFAPVTLPGYQVFNLNARYQIEKNLSVSARIDNLFNSDYMLVHGYNTLDRTLFVGLNYQQ